ncbi:response regulator [Paenibacillus sp. FJAT-26967]|uniref:response regulator n=1 Tax=Paenibacillus sp. FJAT-26967 TaxID=1729690 RepID=UPI000838C97B|nr:response regulator [Paenibacillus sp. FJAT-26967]
MYKVIIADDEAVFRKYLRHAIHWDSYEFEICGEAKNGLEALELVETHSPDIIFADINMPFMDGLTFAERVREIHPHLAVILVTGHSEFEYARRAIRIGVVDYILKPFTEEELLVTLLKVKESLDKRKHRENREQADHLLIRESFLNSLISDEYSSGEELHKNFALFGIPAQLNYFRVASVEIVHTQDQLPDANELRFRKYIIANLLSDLIELEGSHLVFNGPEGRVISIMMTESEEQMPAQMRDPFRKLYHFIKRHFGFNVTVGLGNPGAGCASIRKSYMESIVALQNRMALSGDEVIDYSAVESRTANIGFYPSEINENLLLHLRLHDWDGIQADLKEIYDYIRERHLSGDYTYMILAGLVSLCLTHIYEVEKTVDEVFGSDFLPYREIRNKPSLESTFEWLSGMYLATMNASGSGKLSKAAKLLSLARSYIDEHYKNNELKVEEVSNHLYINSRYLRKIFKNELGLSVNDYITEVRMQKAKDLLSSGNNIRLSDISEMVGYSDPGYFSKTFKKHVGLSPSEYETRKSRLSE